MIDVRLAGRYRLASEIGAGGMTVVWQAIDEVLERPVAVKILHRHLLSNELFCSQFRQEALKAGSLTHPNIVSVYDTGQHDDAPYVVMEYLRGGSLARKLREEGPLPSLRVAAAGADVCEALAYAHRAGIVHRDLKPTNILFSETGLLKVTDFGIARAAFGGDLTATGALIGTLSFLAPEVLEGGEADAAADLYALGVVLFTALTGRSPRLAGSELAASRSRFQPAHPRDFRPDVPRDLDAAVARALADSPGDRFADAAEMGRQLRSVIHTRAARPLATPVVRKMAPEGEDTSFVRSEGRWLAPVVLLVLTAIAIVIGVLQLSGKVSIIGGGSTTPPAPKTAEVQVPVVRGGSYNPPPGDGSEHPELVPAAFDNNPQTFWKTSTYLENFGAWKSGVGIWIDLGKPTALRKIEVDTTQPGWAATVRSSDDAQTWSPPGPSESVDGPQHSFAVSGTHRYWLVWITRLPPQLQATISEIKPFI